MVQWEYRVWHYDGEGYPNTPEWQFVERSLNLPGEEGWELVAVSAAQQNDGLLFHFKRQKAR